MNVVYKQSVLNCIEDERTEAMRLGKTINYIVLNGEERGRLIRELYDLGHKTEAQCLLLHGNRVTLRGILVVAEEGS